MHDLSHQPEIGLEAPAARGKLPQEADVDAVGRVQPQAVDLEFPDPGLHRAEKMVPHVRVGQIELHKAVVPVPSNVGEGVPVRALFSKGKAVKPALAGRRGAASKHVLERPEVPADMIEDRVENDAEALLVHGGDEALQRLVGSQPAVHAVVVRRVIPVAARFEEGAQVDGVRAQIRDVREPGREPFQPLLRGGVKVVLERGPAETEGVDMVENRILRPMIHDSLRHE